MDDNRFTVEEIRNYLLKQDSFGDALYFLNADNIRKAQVKDNKTVENCRFYDCRQGRNLCYREGFKVNKCMGVCEFHEESK